MKDVSFNSALEEIKRRLSITDLVEDYLTLKKSGKGYVGLCPFHDDKNPSMHVSPEKGLFHCFSCGAGGDIYGFLMRYNNISFKEAVEELAKKANVTLPASKTYKKKIDTKSNLLFKVNELINNYYHKNLLSNKSADSARNYLKSRNINSDIAKQFSLGYAPDSWDASIKIAESKNIDLQYLEELGLVVKKTGSNSYYDRFRDRIIFPIIDINEKVVGFGGRSLTDEQQPKYLNSPESKIFQKRNIFYGLWYSKDEIRRNRKAILVEGYMDFISLYKSGVKNVVATLGTSLTKQHCILLKRFCDEVVIVYDGDSSGISSAIRAGEIFIEEGISAKIVLLPEKSDPDTFINENGKEKFDSLVQDSKNIAEYIIENANNRYRAGKITSKECTSLIIDLLSKTTNPVERGLYLTKASNLLGIRESDLLSLIKIKKRKKSEVNTENSQDNNRSVDRLITKILLKYPDIVHEIDTEKVLQNFEDDRLKVIFTRFIENNTDDISSLINSFEESIYQDLISQLVFSSDDLIDKDTSKKILNNCITKLELESIDLKLKEIRFKIEELKNSHDKETEKKLLAEYRDLVELEKSLRGNINDV